VCCGLCKQKSRGKNFPGLVYIILALASLFDPNPLKPNITQGNAYFSYAQDLHLLNISDTDGGLEAVQLGILTAFYLQSTENHSKWWNITGLTIRIAQNMGLHLSVEDGRKRGLNLCAPTQLQTEMRARVWHGCVLLDTYVL
jgi:hypothetical protein